MSVTPNGMALTREDKDEAELDGASPAGGPLTPQQLTQARLRLARDMVGLVQGDVFQAFGGPEACPAYIRLVFERCANSLSI
jgi:hypothetical protein